MNAAVRKVTDNAPLIEHLPSKRYPGKTVCGLFITDIAGRQAVTETPLRGRECITCESIRSHYGEDR
jgi:hypothetical protein